MVRTAVVACFLLCLVPRFTSAAPLIADLRVSQALGAADGVYPVSPKVDISFTLARAAPVVVRIDRHQNRMIAWNGPYLVDTYPVRTLDAGKLPAGRHTITWDGLTADGKPVTAEYNRDAGEVFREQVTDPAKLVQEEVIHLFKITVASGNDQQCVNYLRRVDAADSNLSTRASGGSAADGEGRPVFSSGGLGIRFSLTWAEESVCLNAGQSATPGDAFDCAVDHKGDVYLATSNGVHRFSRAGPAVSWTGDQDYLNYPYPSDFKQLLGVRLDTNARGKKKQYVLGPGGNGHYKYWDTDEMLGKPGFSLRWNGVALDRDDNVYVSSETPANIQVFTNAGDYLRTIILPGAAVPRVMRVGTDGTLWVVSSAGVYGLDPNTGAVRKHLEGNDYHYIFIDAAGHVYVCDQANISRFSPTGDPLPFAPDSPYRVDPGNVINLDRGFHRAARDACGFVDQIGGLFVDGNGSLWVSDRTAGRLLRFSTDGKYQPLPFIVTMGQHSPGNIFLDDAPAVFDLFASHFGPDQRRVTAAWTLTDFDGRQTRGESGLDLSPLADQAIQLVVPAPENGHYRLSVDLKLDGQVCSSLTAMFARIPSRRIYEDRFSPFAVCWGNNFPLMAYAGIKSHRGDSASWNRILEPLDGLFYPQHEDGQGYTDSLEGPRRFARRWGIDQLNGLDYGEGWLGNYDLISRIWSYDRFYGYGLRVLDAFAGKNEPFYQFWNEPNFFWHVPGPFGREHFGLVTQHVWSMIKARDRDAFSIPDGDAGGTAMEKEMADWGVAPYMDGIQIHYPGSVPIQFDKIMAPDTPEGKVAMCQDLIAIRDRSFPGKPAWNTEEGWWGAQVKTFAMGAIMVPRTYIPQLAAGIDKLYWFMSVSDVDTTYLLTDREEPYPTYVSYATMSRLLDQALYVGSPDLGPGNYGALFARKKGVVVAVWRLQGEQKVTLPLGERTVTVTDLMGRSREVMTDHGVLSLPLTDHVQYVELPLNAWAKEIGRRTLAAVLEKADVPSARSILDVVREVAPKAASDPAAMNRLYYILKAARLASAIRAAPVSAYSPARLAAAGRDAVTAREGDDGYLRQTRVALEWLDQVAAWPSSDGNAWPPAVALAAVKGLAQAEQPCYPGVVIDAFIGEPGEVAKIRAVVPKLNDYTTTIDEKFRFQIDRKAGDSFDLELTVWDEYRHPIEGVLRPRLPEGWTADRAEIPFDVKPGEFQRTLLTVTIAAGARGGLYTVGGQTVYRGQTVQEIHPERIRVGD